MIRVGILTINDNSNYGNRLQSYAVQEFLKREGCIVENIQNIDDFYNKNYYKIIKENVKLFFKIFSKKPIHRRQIKFFEFNKNIRFSKIRIDNNHISKKLKYKYDYFITGSDQVWNPYNRRLSDIDLLEFADDSKKISFSASFGISELPSIYTEKVTKALSTFKAISVREYAGKKIIENLTGRKDVEVLIDPTLLLSDFEWDKVLKKPKQLKNERYILNYFLGDLSEERKSEIDRVSKENNCIVINLLDKNSPFYQTGPSEFLYLVKNAFLICTDSFHACVFSLIYNKTFVVFEREDSMAKMNSRIETLLNKFNLKNREYNGKNITEDNLKHDYYEAYNILESEKEKSKKYIKKALEL